VWRCGGGWRRACDGDEGLEHGGDEGRRERETNDEACGERVRRGGWGGGGGVEMICTDDIDKGAEPEEQQPLPAATRHVTRTHTARRRTVCKQGLPRSAAAASARRSGAERWIAPTGERRGAEAAGQRRRGSGGGAAAAGQRRRGSGGGASAAGQRRRGGGNAPRGIRRR
jgi:hypothetical protein